MYQVIKTRLGMTMMGVILAMIAAAAAMATVASPAHANHNDSYEPFAPPVTNYIGNCSITALYPRFYTTSTGAKKAQARVKVYCSKTTYVRTETQLVGWDGYDIFARDHLGQYVHFDLVRAGTSIYRGTNYKYCNEDTAGRDELLTTGHLTITKSDGTKGTAHVESHYISTYC
jgi:hypothetical protein